MSQDMLRVKPDRAKISSLAVAGTPFISHGWATTSAAGVVTGREGLQEPFELQESFVEWVYHPEQFYRKEKDISPEAERRFKGHERVVQKALSLAEKEAQARRISLLKIEVRPAWSHEYEERTGVVIDVEIKATPEERFSYWDAVCEKLDQLEDSLPPEERRFLNDDISFVVSRG